MIGRCRWGILLLIVSVGPATVVTDVAIAADVDSPSVMYSHGVHAYYSGNLNRAEMYLYRASELNPNDPRPHYFRGLALMRQGRSWEGEEALEAGAAAEARADTSAYNIGQALERVQGAHRLRLEEIRREAQLQAGTSSAENARRRYEQLDRRQSQVQRTPFRLSLEALVNPVQPGQIPESTIADAPITSEAEPIAPVEEFAAADQGDPFVDDPTPEAPATTEEVAVDVPDAARGSVKAGSLPGIFGRMIGSRLPSVDVQGLRDRVPGLGGGGAPPELAPGDFGGPGEFDFSGEAPAPEGDPFGTEEPTPPAGEVPTEEPAALPAADEENTFDF